MKTKKKQLNKNVLKLRKRLHRQIKLAIVPHRSNQYRPHMIRRYGIAVVLVLVIGIQLGYNVATTGRVLGSQSQVAAIDLLADTNAQRQSYGIAPLEMSAQLSEAAFMKGQDMLDKQYWAHQAPDGTTPWHWFGQVDYNYNYAGENLARGFVTANAATLAWMASPEHRSNLLDEHYSQAGFAVIDGTLNGKPTSIIVALYGSPAAPVAATTSVAGVQTATAPVEAPAPHSLSLVARLGVGVQSMTPAALGSAVLMVIAASVAGMAHMYRHKLPKMRREAWHLQHHGVLKASGMLSLTLIVVFMYSGGQI